jgi:hypothetical protein
VARDAVPQDEWPEFAEDRDWEPDDPDDDRFDTYCDSCGGACDCLTNGMCPMCYECRGGLNPADEHRSLWD